MSQPIKLYSHPGGPNPWKVAILLQELGVPYETEIKQFDQLKTPEYESIWINGRVPAIQDPNTGITLGESGAIIEYLIATYDKDHKFSFDVGPDHWQALQWLHFQMSGQGPYFGQAAWFHLLHSDKNITSAKERYVNEIDRITSVLDRHLQQSGDYLVGGKLSFADLSFIPWYWLLNVIVGEEKADSIRDKYPKAKRWLETMNARPTVAKVAKDRADAIAAGK